MQLQAVFLPFVVAVLLHMQALYLQNGIHVGALYCGVLPFRHAIYRYVGFINVLLLVPNFLRLLYVMLILSFLSTPVIKLKTHSAT